MNNKEYEIYEYWDKYKNIYKKTYIYPDGTRQTFQTTFKEWETIKNI